MTKTFPSLLRLVVVLAMLCSLVAITAAPASALVTNTSASASPATAGSAASYSLAFTTTADVAAGGTVTVTFPTGVTLPASFSRSLISLSDAGAAIDYSGSTDPDPSIVGQTVVLTIPSGETLNLGACTLTISQAAGITNPAVAKTAASLAYPVYVRTSAEASATTPAYMQIVPSYTVSPTSGDRATEVTVTGAGWSPNGGVTVAGGLEGTATADATGAFTLTGTVPAAASGGTNNVTIVDGLGQTQAAPWVGAGAVTVPTFTLLPRLVVSPASGNVGATVAALGYDFATTGNITANSVTLGGTAQTHAKYILTTRDAFGVLDDAYVTFTVPATAANTAGGGKTIVMTDGTNSATATFTLNTPTITVEPSSGEAYQMVSITGSNFQAGDTIPVVSGLQFKAADWNTSVITVDASGGWTYSKRVPAGAVSGSNPVTVTTTAGTTAEASYTVAARALTLTPATGPSGTQVTVTGSNMTADATIPVNVLTFAGGAWNTSANNGAISIDSLGNLSPRTMRVPTSSATGSNLVSGSDTGADLVAATTADNLTATAYFTVTQPTIEISPSSGYLGDTISVTGAGWVSGTGGLVTLTFNAVTQVVTTPAADGTISAQFALPLTAVSGQLVDATDGYGNNAADKAFQLSPASITIDPATGPGGSVATVTGVGFQPQSAVSALTVGGGNVLPTTAQVTDTLGGFSIEVAIPGLASGAQTVSATVLSTTTTTFFTISATQATVASALQSISDVLVRVWSYVADPDAEGQGKWLMYDPADAVGSDLASLTEGKGYWVNVTAPVTVVYLGKSRTLDITGWNMMGW